MEDDKPKPFDEQAAFGRAYVHVMQITCTEQAAEIMRLKARITALVQKIQVSENGKGA